MTDLAFWLGLALAIPLSIAGNFATVWVQRWWSNRPQRAVASKRDSLARRIERVQLASTRFASPVEYGVSRLLVCFKLVSAMIAVGLLAVIILTGSLGLLVKGRNDLFGIASPTIVDDMTTFLIIDVVLAIPVAFLFGLLSATMDMTIQTMRDMGRIEQLKAQLVELDAREVSN